MEQLVSTRIVFMGTPDFSVPALKALLNTSSSDGWRVVAVVTQPDRPSGRGKKLTPPPVKMVAEAAGLSVLQPEKLRRSAAEELATYQPDLVVVAAFGQILRKRVLNMPPYGCINIHASLLPRWRGAAPVAAAIKAGDTVTGVTLMHMGPGLDTGPTIAKRAVPITPQHTGGSLTDELAQVGADLLVDTLPAWLAGDIEPEPQTESMATFAPLLKKEDGNIDWSEPAVVIERMVRAFDPWPATFTVSPRGPLKILAVEIPEIDAAPSVAPGTIFKFNKQPHVATGRGALRLVSVQPAGKKPMPAEAMMNGQPELWGSRLGVQ